MLHGSLFYRKVVEHTRHEDPQNRPVTFVTDKDFDNDRAVRQNFNTCTNSGIIMQWDVHALGRVLDVSNDVETKHARLLWPVPLP